MKNPQKPSLPSIIIDADACPRDALETAKKLGLRYGLACFTVASVNHMIDGPNHITVGADPQETDMKIVNITRKGDIVVTQDFGLAAIVLARGTLALSPRGKEYRPDSIDFLLEERSLKSRVRRGGGRTKGPAPRTKEDEQSFAHTLEKMILRVIAKHAGGENNNTTN